MLRPASKVDKSVRVYQCRDAAKYIGEPKWSGAQQGFGPAVRGKAAFSMTTVAELLWNDQNLIVLGAVPDRDPKTDLCPAKRLL
jgi:hypothetical protein